MRSALGSLVGTVLGKYELLEEVGHGGMAIVYRGHDTVLQREVAVKVLHAHLADREESRLRLQREALAVAKLRHDNILEIFDYSGLDAEACYIVTEFIHGPTLKDWLELHKNPRPAMAVMIVHRLALALSHAHKSGIIHRDIKPENVMLRASDGSLKLMDFGIAQLLDNQKLTMTGQLIGSPAYMAPELIGGRSLDARTDLFSLGILLYQLATGALPFAGRNPHEVLNRIADGEYPQPSTLCPWIDSELEARIQKALAVNPDERYQSAQAFAADLESYLHEMGLEPTSAEVAAYFRDPDNYSVELDARIGRALTERAAEAVRDGNNARAIRMLGRVLELDPEHGQAREMLERLRQRARRTQQLLWSGAGLAFAGLIAAGAVLLRPDPHAPSSTGALAKPVAVARSPAVTRPGRDTARAVVAPPSASDPVEASESTAADPPPSDPLGERAIAAKPRPKRGAESAGASVPCRITITGMTASAARSHRIAWGDADEALGGLAHSVRLDRDSVRVSITGPAYGGSTTITKEQCRSGAPVVVKVNAEPALLEFRGAPDRLIVVCRKGCRNDVLGRNQLAQDFESVTIPDGVAQRVLLAFKHEDFAPQERWVTLYPGRNVVLLDLQPR